MSVSITTHAIKKLITSHQMIFGSAIAWKTAQKIKGIKINPDGGIVILSNDLDKTLQDLIDAYFPISGVLSQQIIKPYIKTS